MLLIPANDSASNPISTVEFVQGEEHFDELISIISAYEFDDVDLPHEDRKRESVSFDETKAHRQVSITVYDDIIERQGENDEEYLNYDPENSTLVKFHLNEMGEININNYLYTM